MRRKSHKVLWRIVEKDTTCRNCKKIRKKPKKGVDKRVLNCYYMQAASEQRFFTENFKKEFKKVLDK